MYFFYFRTTIFFWVSTGNIIIHQKCSLKNTETNFKRKFLYMPFNYIKFHFYKEINKTVELCMCPCQAAPKWYNFTQEDVSLWLQEFKDNICKKLVLSKRDLTSYRRRRISVPDHRSSVTRLGVVGAIIICALIGAIISCDCPRFWRHALRLRRRYYLKHVKLYP